MPGRLLYRDAQGRDAHVDIPNEGVYLGRGADCAVRTDDAMVSRKNCKIAFVGGRWMVEDLGSSNGTFVNEQRIQKHPLTHADVIRCGTLQVRFVEVAAGQPSSGKPRTMSLEPQGGGGGSVQVDPSIGRPLDPANLMHMKDQEIASAAAERDQLAARLRDVAQEMQSMSARHEAAEDELKRLRQENVTMRDRLADVTRQKSLQDEELHAQVKVGEELRLELATLRDEHLQTRTRADEMAEEVSARDRQLERAHEDLQRARVATDELRNAMAELQRTKDEGWRELNKRVGEIDNLREVISEQERMLEERRVGLITLEASQKEIRAERERLMRDMVQIKTERDELRDRSIRQQATVEALEEEHRRLARAIADGGGGGGGGGVGNEEHMRLATELRELKIESKKLESDRNRLTEQVKRLESERHELEDKLAKVDVERATLQGGTASVESARKRAEELMAKAETARQRAEEEKQAAAAARDAALATADQLRRDLDRERKHVQELEAQQGLAGRTADMPAVNPADFADEATPTGHPTHDGEVSPEARIHELEEELAKLATELAVAREAPGGGGGNGVDVAEIKKRAEDAYNGINDVLSELRTSILLARDLAQKGGAPELNEAIQSSVDRTEDAKGLLRTLREVIE
jgi:pSer/pThr/pTyr-binding forkhead associated (FHA) protein